MDKLASKDIFDVCAKWKYNLLLSNTDSLAFFLPVTSQDLLCEWITFKECLLNFKATLAAKLKQVQVLAHFAHFTKPKLDLVLCLSGP